MKATIIILVICFLFTLVNSFRIPKDPFTPDLEDYTTGRPIRMSDACVIKAFFNGKHYYVDDKALRPWVRLRMGQRPLHFVRLVPVVEEYPNMNIKAGTPIRIKFNDTESFLGLQELYKISETSKTIAEEGQFVIYPTEESRVYDLALEKDFGSIDIGKREASTFYVGMKEESTDNRYYLAAFSILLPNPKALGLHKIQFTFSLA